MSSQLINCKYSTVVLKMHLYDSVLSQLGVLRMILIWTRRRKKQKRKLDFLMQLPSE